MADNNNQAEIGEVISLAGKLTGTKMGDRYQTNKPTHHKYRKLTSDRYEEGATAFKIKRLGDEEDVDEYLSETGTISYRPATENTKQAYHSLLNFIQDLFGHQPRNFVKEAAEELLCLLKDETLTDKDRKRQIQAINGQLSNEQFELLINLGKAITDFKPGDKKASSNHRFSQGVSVQFEDSDCEENEGEHVEIADEEENSTAEDEPTEKLSRVMTNSTQNNALLPDGSIRKQRIGYEEIQVPALQPYPADNEDLVPIDQLPKFAQNAFTEETELNPIQSKVYNALTQHKSKQEGPSAVCSSNANNNPPSSGTNVYLD